MNRSDRIEHEINIGAFFVFDSDLKQTWWQEHAFLILTYIIKPSDKIKDSFALAGLDLLQLKQEAILQGQTVGEILQVLALTINKMSDEEFFVYVLEFKIS